MKNKNTIEYRLGVLKKDGVKIVYPEGNKKAYEIGFEEDIYNYIISHDFFNNKIKSSFVSNTYDFLGKKNRCRMYTFNNGKEQLQISIPLERKLYQLGLKDRVVAQIALNTLYENYDILKSSDNKKEINESIKLVRDELKEPKYDGNNLKKLLSILSKEPNRVLLNRIIREMRNYKDKNGKTIDELGMFLDSLVEAKKEARVVFSKRFQKIAATAMIVGTITGFAKFGADSIARFEDYQQEQTQQFLEEHPGAYDAISNDYAVDLDKSSKTRWTIVHFFLIML